MNKYTDGRRVYYSGSINARQDLRKREALAAYEAA